MTAVHGKNTRLYFGAVDVSSYMNEAKISATVDTADKSAFGMDAREYVPGQKTRAHSAEGHYDKDNTVIQASLGVADGVLTHCPGGASAIGDLAWMSSVIGTQFDKSSPIADIVAFSWEAPASGPTAFGYILHPLAEDTNTTTGATRDDSASTSTGWVAHLHVTAVDAGSWVIKLVDGAASNMSDAADLTGGAFTAATGATSQRLVSAASTTTVKRYLRYVATRTGGSGGDGITFVLGFSRVYNP